MQLPAGPVESGGSKPLLGQHTVMQTTLFIMVILSVVRGWVLILGGELGGELGPGAGGSTGSPG